MKISQKGRKVVVSFKTEDHAKKFAKGFSKKMENVMEQI